jgi:chloramphenicol-sensitive protein RarD
MWGLFPLYFHFTEPASPLEVLFHRMVWTLVLLGIVLSLRGQWAWLRTVVRDHAIIRRVTVAAAALSLNWGVYIWAVNNDHVVDAALGYFINPLVTVALGVAVLGERLRRLQLGAVALGAVAVVVLTAAYGRVPVVALVLAASFASYGFLKKTLDLPSVSSLWLETATMLPVAIIGFIVLGARGDITIASHGLGHASLLVGAGAVTAVPLVLFGIAARGMPLSMLGLLQYLTPVLQLLCGVIAFREGVPAARWMGFVIVWCALALLVFDASRRRGVPSAPAGGAAGSVEYPSKQVSRRVRADRPHTPTTRR